MNAENGIELITIAEFQQRLHVSRTTVFQWIKNGRLKAGYHFLRKGRCLRFFWGAEVIRSLHDHDVIEPKIAPPQIVISRPVIKASKKKTIINMNY